MHKIIRLEVHPINPINDLRFGDIIKEVPSLAKIHKAKYYLLNIKEEKVESVLAKAREILLNPLLECLMIDGETDEAFLEIGHRPGVTDNLGKVAREAFALYDLDVDVSSGELYKINLIESNLALEIANNYLANPLLHHIRFLKVGTDRFENCHYPHFKSNNSENLCKRYNLDQSDRDLLQLSEDNCWALSRYDMAAIRDYFFKDDVQAARAEIGIAPTDVELEILAQTWSEHCKHRIFSAQIDYSEEDMPEHLKKIGSKKIDSIYKTYIKGITKYLTKEGLGDHLISVFSDNAGIVRYFENTDVAIKVETHNSPSALDPYGGALTGILGVNRDIMGVGLGARPIANTDVFCFAPNNFYQGENKKNRPLGIKDPFYIMKGVHRGVMDGGNKSGIPTVNGAIYFDPSYAGKPLVYCGTIGILPQKLNDGTPTHKKNIKVGDLIVVAGGRVGKDGIHGATFSSMEMKEESPSTVVQIGDPLTQKRLLDFTLAARDKNLFTGLTDNGAGGLSSSIGEMAEFTGGALLDLKKVPLKYQGLAPFEIMISESQERMSYAVSKDFVEEFKELAGDFGVEVCVLGEFNDSGYFHVTYGEETIAYLDLDFMHSGAPIYNLKARFDPSPKRQALGKKIFDGDWMSLVQEALPQLLESPNIASKEKWVRQYDHEVQASTIIKPFAGDGVNNAGVIDLSLHGEEGKGVSIASGLNPRINDYDTYIGAKYSIDEAVRNSICHGADISKMVLVDNFCWPDPIETAKNPDGPHKLGQLIRSCEGLYDIAKAYKMPFVSGKDSMKNDFVGQTHDGRPVKISVLPTLLITSLAPINDIKNCRQSFFHQEGDLIYHLGKHSNGLWGSELAEVYNTSTFDGLDKVPDINEEENYKLYLKMNECPLIKSCHDISDGGLLVALAEKCFSKNLGADILLDYESEDLVNNCFGEASGRFIVTIDAHQREEFEVKFKGFFESLGTVCLSNQLTLKTRKGSMIFNINKLKERWSQVW